MRAKITNLEYVENNIYVDNHKRYFLADKKNRCGYLIENPKDKVLFIFKNRIAIAVILGILLGATYNWTIGLAIGAAMYAILELIYRKKFLPQFEVYDNIEFPEISEADKYLKRDSATNITKGFIGICIVILAIVNLFTTITDFSVLTNISEHSNELLLVLITIAGVIYIGRISYFCLTTAFSKKKK